MSQELDEFLRRREMEASAPARAVVKSAAAQKIEPDAAAKQAATARRYGVSPAVVAAAPDLFKEEDAADEADRIITGAPTLGNWLAQREHNAAMARDDLPNMADTSIVVTGRKPRESIFGQITNMALEPIKAVARWHDNAILGKSEPLDVTGFLAGVGEAASPENLGRAWASGLLGIGTGTVGVAAAAENLNPLSLVREMVTGYSPRANLEGLGQGIAGVQQTVRPEAKNSTAKGILSGVESIPSSVAAVVAGSYLRSAKAASILMGGVTGGQSYLSGRGRGLSPTAATFYGGIDAAIEAGTEMLPFHQLIGGMNRGAPFIERFVKTSVAEGVGEQLATFGQDFNEWASIDSNNGKPFSAFWAERPEAAYQTFVAALVTTGAINVAGEAYIKAGNLIGRTYARAEPAERDAETLKLLGQLATASKVLQRDPASFEEFVQQAAGTTTAEDVFIDAGELAQVLDQSGLSLEDAAQLTGVGVNDLQLAMDTGADVRIPIGTYAARVAVSDIGPKLIDHLRIDPESMSKAEAKVFMQSAEQELQSLADTAVAVGLESDEKRVSMERVREQIMGELTQAGRFSPSVNEAYATLHATAMANIAARNGMTAEQLAERYGLKVQSGEVAQPTFDQAPARVNIGLAKSSLPGSEDLTPEQVHAALANIGVSIKQSAVHPSGTEPTVVADLDRELTDDEVFALADTLRQEGISQFAGGQGKLLGPLAEKWGPFNPEYFLDMAGQPMSQTMQQDALELAQHVPGLDNVMPYLTDEEKARLRKKSAESLMRIVDSYPSAEEMASVAFAGRAKRGWYERSALALLDVFGAEDAPRFAGLLAALSPQVSVESNTINALKTWVNWDRAGRPTDRRAIIEILGQSVQGGKGVGSVLNAWINNAVRALSTENVHAIELSGPKVNSFMLNLMGVVDEVTVDAWMANYALMDQGLVGGRGVKNQTGDVVKAKSPGYMGVSSVVRRAAQIVSERTGQVWTPAEVQETVWSWVKTLTEQTAAGPVSAQELLAAGGLTHDQIADTPDFAILFQRGVFRRVLEEGGYGQELDAIESSGRAAGSLGEQGSVAVGEGSGLPEDAFFADLFAAAGRIDERRQQRRQDDQLRLFNQGALSPFAVPLEGLPDTSPGPFGPAHAAALAYMDSVGIPYAPPSRYVKVKKERAARIAQAFEDMPHAPEDPEVRASYSAMAEETLAQWNFIKDTGLQVEFAPSEGDPYGGNPWGAVRDVRDNNHIYVFNTEDGYGQEGITAKDLAENPMLALVPGEEWSGRPVRVNDIFRAVHDYFGHIKDGNGFRAGGEENAWRSHAAMYSPIARRAMTTETRGQNSWLNYGPHGDTNRTASVEDTIFAEQKIGLMPDWTMEEGRLDEPTAPPLAPSTEDQLNEIAAQLGVVDPERRVALYRDTLIHNVRVAEGGKLLVLADAKFKLEPSYQERIAKHNARFVAADDNAWLSAKPLTLTEPPVNSDGTLTLQHYSTADFSVTDPTRWGQNPVTRGERNGSGPPRTYFGVATGVPGGYKNEQVGAGYRPVGDTRLYEARIPKERLYNAALNPDGLEGSAGAYENAIKAAGYAGYWTSNDALGLVAVVFDPTEVQQVPFDETGVFLENPTQPLYQRTGQPRGQISMAADITTAPSVVTLLRGADLSTFLHESGHFYWEVLTDLAARPGASADVKADVQRMLEHVGVTDLATWLRMSTAEKRPAHEKIARSFEAYLFEGNAPNPEMRGLFGRLAQWLRAVYKQLVNLNVELTPEVRGVFDRMLASDEEINEAQIEQGLAPLLEERPAEVEARDWANYQRQGLEATEEAVHELAARSLRDMQYAGRAAARELKRLRREQSENRKATKAEVEDEFGAEPIYRAIRYLRTGQLDDSPKVEGEPYKLQTNITRELLQLGDDPLPAALNGMTSSENGVHPQQIADLFGFQSANHLLHDLLFTSPFTQAVEAETDNRMRERFGELSSPEAVEQAVQSAIHNEVRGRFVATELAMLQKAPGKRRALTAAASKLARDTISRLKLRNVRPGQYEAGERREARLAMATRGDLAEAAAHKRNQLLQFHLAREAHAARDEAESIRRYLAKFDKANVRKAIDRTFLDQIDQLLEAVQLKSISDVEAQRRTAMHEWIERMRGEGFEPVFDAEFLAQLGKRAFRDLTVDEIRQLNEAIKNIEWLGRRTKELLTAKDKADLDQAANEVGDAVRTFATRSIDEGVGSPNWWDMVRSGVKDFFAQHRKFANLAYVMDGNRYGGAVWERFVRGMNTAGDRETTMNSDATKRLAAIFDMLKGMDMHTRAYEPDIGKPVSMETRVMVALNWGNSTNRARVMDGDGWTQEQVEDLLGPLTEQHWNFVEAVWDFIDSYWPGIAAKQERVTGVAPEKVQAEPFQYMVNGELRLLRGGYFPIKYDPDRSSKAEADTAAEIQKQMLRGLYTNASTRRGHTKERVDTVRGRPIRKDFGVIFGHTTQIIHDLAWHEWLIDANRLLKHAAVDSAVREHYGPETLRWMRKAFEDIAAGDIPAQNAAERAVNHIRTGVSISSMGWSLWTSLLQPLGLTQSISRIGVKHVAKGIGDMFGSPQAMNDKLEWIYTVSPFMRERARTMQREVNEIRNQVGPKSPLRRGVEKVIPGPAAAFVSDSWFYMLGKAQLVADLPTWLGQYEKSMAAGEQPDRAAAIADQAVIDSQSSGMIKDLAGIQRGGPIWKLWTSFYSYFSATFNLVADRTAELRRKGPADLPYFAVDVAMLTFVPATLASIMFGVLRGGDDDDAEDWIKRIAADNLNYMLGTMIGLREVGGALTGVMGYTGPAGARVFSAIGGLGKQVAQGDVDEAAMRSANAVAGILLHYPASQIEKTIRGTRDWINGDAGPQAVLVGPPPKR